MRGKSVRTISRSIWIGTSILLAQLVFAGQSVADWSVYVAPGLGISDAAVETDGQTGPGLPVTPTQLNGSDQDASPLLSLAVGLEVPMDELVPREWLLNVRLPDWPVRVELEAAGLREYEIRTNVGPGADIFTEIQATTTMVNFWLDIPMLAAYKPLQYTFSLGRQPVIRRWLEPAGFYMGVGLGFSSVEIDGRSNIVSGDDDSISFAWNAGVGLTYALTENVILSTGYRYVDIGDRSIDLVGGTPGPNDEVDFIPDLHEFRVAIRVRVWDFFSPWR